MKNTMAKNLLHNITDIFIFRRNFTSNQDFNVNLLERRTSPGYPFGPRRNQFYTKNAHSIIAENSHFLIFRTGHVCFMMTQIYSDHGINTGRLHCFRRK